MCKNCDFAVCCTVVTNGEKDLLKNKKLFQMMFSKLHFGWLARAWIAWFVPHLGFLIYPPVIHPGGMDFGIVTVGSPKQILRSFLCFMYGFLGFMYRFEQFSFVPLVLCP